MMRFLQKLLLIYLIIILSVAWRDISTQYSESSCRNLPITPQKSITNIKSNLEKISPFYRLNSEEVITYSPVILIPNMDWYKRNNLIFNSSLYVPYIYLNNKILQTDNEITHQKLCTYGLCWNTSEYNEIASVTIFYDIRNMDLEQIINASITVQISIQSPNIFNMKNSEIRFGMIKDPYDSIDQNTDITLIYYPDGFMLKYYINSQGESETWVLWTTEDEYHMIYLLFEHYNFFLLRDKYFDQQLENNTSFHFISLTFWTADGTYTRYTKYFAGLAVPESLLTLWSNLYSLTKLYETEFTIRTHNTGTDSLIAISSSSLLAVTILKKLKLKKS